MHWKLWPTLYWAFWFLAFAIWETYAGVSRKHDVPMLTQAVVRYIPWYVMLPFLTWLLLHFAVRYASPEYKTWLNQGY